MPLVILLAGIVLIAAGINNRLDKLIELIRSDFAPDDGSVPFGTWMLAISVIGSVGYIKEARGFANTFIALIFIAIFLSNKGFYAKFTDAFSAQSLTSAGTSSDASGSGSTGPGSIGSGLGSIGAGSSSGGGLGSLLSSLGASGSSPNVPAPPSSSAGYGANIGDPTLQLPF